MSGVLVRSAQHQTVTAIFERTLAGLDHDERVLFVGDSMERDMRPAHALGLSTAWIASSTSWDPAARFAVPDVLAPETVAA